jgi:hypothetical protein
MNPRLTAVLGAFVALLFMLALVAIWKPERIPSFHIRAPRTNPGPATPPPPTVTAAPSEEPDFLSDATVHKLLIALARVLARGDVRENETVLTFKDDAALARFLARAEKEGLNILGRLDTLRAVRVKADNLAALEAELTANASDYADVSGNYIFDVPHIPAKEDRPAIDQIPFGNAALSFIGANGDRSQWGRGILVAVLDTGIAMDSTFGTGRVTAIDIGLGISPGKAQDDGHGTSVASLAAGSSADAPGVAPAANLLSIRVTDANSRADIFTLAQGIVAAVDAGAKVINVSLGGYGTNTALSNAIGYASDHGAVIVAAAGNDQAAQLNWPAADPRVISVGAVDRAGQQVSFSNAGAQLQLTAPGLGVQTAWLDGQRVYVDGTSASAPLVSGAIAALLSQNPTLTPQTAATLLTKTANDAGVPGADPAYGNGILNLGWALNANNPTYVDTAVSSHYFDAANNQMDFVVQNRSGEAMAGMSLNVAAGTTTTSYLVSNLPPGGTQVIKVPVDSAQLRSAGQIQYTTTLVNPIGIVDQVPSNNRRSSVLTAPTK